jgi:hypothetical protein
MERRSDPDLNQVLRGRPSGPRAGTVVDARMTLALWLRAGRSQRGMSLEDVARITKIQVRILERLEAGKPDGLPADVFVRGFVRSVAKCVGLDEDEALKRYSACSGGATAAPAAARAMVEAMGDLAPTLGQTMARPTTPPAPAAPARQTRDLIIPDDFVLRTAAVEAAVVNPASSADFDALEVELEIIESPAASQPIVEAVEVAAPVEAVAAAVEPAAPAKKKRGKRAPAAGPAKPRAKRKTSARMATGTPFEPTPVIDTSAKADGDVVAAKRDVDPSVTDDVVAAKRDVDPSVTDDVVAAKRDVDPSVTDVDVVAAKRDVDPSARDAAVVSIEIVVDSAPAANVIDASNASDDLFAPKLTVYDPDDLFAPRAYDPDVTSDAASSTSTAIDAGDALPATEPQSSTLDADMVETFGDEVIATVTWQPKMPPLAATSSVPWRRPGMVASTAPVASLVAVIDDADPEGAERLLEERRSTTTTQRRSFLPPILLDREDRSARQGGLTLAVIILLIAATLTLSYLMRRPSSSGDGVTQRDVATETLA